MSLQVAYLAEHPDVAVVGGGVRTFVDHGREQSVELGERYYTFPTHPARVRSRGAHTATRDSRPQSTLSITRCEVLSRSVAEIV